MEQGDNAYAILNVDETATAVDIKKAYRKLALKHHPDRATTEADKKKANDIFAKIAAAYEILGDEDLRSKYDRDQSDNVYTPATSSTGTYSTGKSKSNNKKTAGFQPSHFANYNFMDPYEVFKRDFKQQYGMEYPGAQFDFCDPKLIEQANKMKAQKAKGVAQKEPTLLLKNGPDTGKSDSSPKKKGASRFNPFRRNKNNTPASPQKAPQKAHDKKTTTTSRPESNTAAKDNKNETQLAVRESLPTALVAKIEGDNRATITDVKTTERKVDGRTEKTTVITMTRPDGSTESVTMRSGLPPPKPKMLENGKKPTKLLTNGKKPMKAITNGTKKTTPKLENGAKSTSKAKANKRSLVPFGSKK